MNFPQKLHYKCLVEKVQIDPWSIFNLKININFQLEYPKPLKISSDEEIVKNIDWVHRTMKRGRLFIGNSLICRHFDRYLSLFTNDEFQADIFLNRGHSGIEGSIASICGLADEPTIGVVGDISFLYDINALEIVRKYGSKLKILVINNGGGGIFRTLEYNHDLISTPHNISIKDLSKAFGLKYLKIVDYCILDGSIWDLEAQIIEVMDTKISLIGQGMN